MGLQGAVGTEWGAGREKCKDFQMVSGWGEREVCKQRPKRVEGEEEEECSSNRGRSQKAQDKVAMNLVQV